MNINVQLVISAILLLLPIFVNGTLKDSLKYYETLNKNDVQHKIMKRGNSFSYHPFNTIKEVEFKIFGKKFRLILHPHKEIVHHQFKAYEVAGDGIRQPVHIDYDNFYTGRVFGENESNVRVHIEPDGLITGVISVPKETYHIEPSWRHSITDPKSHMITYRLSDIKLNATEPHLNHSSTSCGFVKEGLELETENGFETTKSEYYHSLWNGNKFNQKTPGNKLKREKRQSDQYEYTPTKTRCPLLLVADYRFFQEMGGSNTKTTINYLISLIDRVHKIYNDTIWQDRSDQEGFKEYFKNGYTLYLNSGLSSSRNHYGQRVITREADLVTAHEFGHNWGSEHDPDIPECSPSASQGGSYLMYTYSVSGYDVNNKKFSPCSLRSIRKVLQAKSGRCFSEPEESFCGNLRVEGDEQCDAGLLGTEDNDACCDKNCKLRRGANCSDKNSPCCQNCRFMLSGVKCREAQYATCEQEARCTGDHAECPKSPAMSDGTMCQERGQCRNGKCVPYCETQGLQSCMCDIIQDACKRCCRMSINETCFPVEPPDILPDGTPCIQGFCNKGVCEKTIQDVVERFWDIIEEININKVLRFLKDNIVMTIVVTTAIFWIPGSFVISYFDRKKRRQEFKSFEWSQSLDLIHPSDRRRVIHIRVPRQKITVARM